MTASAVLRWLARALSLGLFALFAVVAAGEGWPDLATWTGAEIASLLAAATMLLGALVAFRRTITGSTIIVVGYAWLCALDGTLRLEGPFVAFPLVALLYAAARWSDRRSSPPTSDPIA